MISAVWDEYTRALDELAAAPAAKQEKLQTIERERLDAAARAERQARESSQGLVGLTNRSAALATRIRRFGAEVGVADAPSGDVAELAVERIPVLLADLEKRLKKAEDARAWLARFAQSAADQESARERQRLVDQARTALPTPAASVTPEAVPARRALTPLVVVAISGAALLVLGTVVTIVVLAQ